MKIAICVPVREEVSTDFLGSFLNLIFENMRKYELIVSLSDICPIERARNDLVERSLKHSPDYVLFVDSDMILPENILDSLINMKKDISSALYFIRLPPYKPLAKIIKDGLFYNLDAVPLNQIIEVDSVGMGCVLIKREVFEKLIEKDKKIFDTKEINVKDKTQLLSEDTFFCSKARELGFKIFLNTGLICKHEGKSFIDENLYNFYLHLQNENK